MTCSICGEEFSEFACYASPIIDASCCSRCDDLIVTPVRILGTALPSVANEIVAVFRNTVVLRARKKELIAEWQQKRESAKREDGIVTNE
jgi:hypothetical protein